MSFRLWAEHGVKECSFCFETHVVGGRMDEGGDFSEMYFENHVEMMIFPRFFCCCCGFRFCRWPLLVVLCRIVSAFVSCWCRWWRWWSDLVHLEDAILASQSPTRSFSSSSSFFFVAKAFLLFLLILHWWWWVNVRHVLLCFLITNWCLTFALALVQMGRGDWFSFYIEFLLNFVSFFIF